MKSILIGVATLALLVGACTGTPEEVAAKRTVAVELAIERIERFNEMGIDPIKLDDTKLLLLDTACVVAMLGGVELGVDADKLMTVAAVCDVIKKAAAEAN